MTKELDSWETKTCNEPNTGEIFGLRFKLVDKPSLGEFYVVFFTLLPQKLFTMNLDF